jgi:hypothetical protein
MICGVRSWWYVLLFEFVWAVAYGVCVVSLLLSLSYRCSPSTLPSLHFQDNESFQAKFNSLIALNQANRGDLVRSPTRAKLATFIGQLNEGSAADPTSLWYFLSIHDTILFPLVEFLNWKERIEQDQDQDHHGRRQRPKSTTTTVTKRSIQEEDEDEANIAKLTSEEEDEAKRPRLV